LPNIQLCPEAVEEIKNSNTVNKGKYLVTVYMTLKTLDLRTIINRNTGEVPKLQSSHETRLVTSFTQLLRLSAEARRRMGNILERVRIYL
jgi:hypothetical protein